MAVLTTCALAEQRVITFDIEPQSLTTAIERFSAATGQDLVYNSNLTSGRQSHGVRGQFAMDVALVKLLENTGLLARQMDNGSFVLAPAAATLGPSTSGTTAQFYARLQSGLRRALCGNQDAKPGRYRLAMRLWINRAGRLTRYEQVGSGGSTEIDGAIRHAVSQLDFGEAPPADIEQPVVIVILPQAHGVTMACDSAAVRPERTMR